MLLKIFKVTALVLVSVILLAAGTFAILYYNTATRMSKHYSVNPQSISIEGDSVQLAYGARLTMSKGCKDCHGSDLGGNVFLDDPGLGRIVAKNLTKGKGGLPEDYDTRDWVRALKHGIKRDGTPLLIMPSHEFTLLSEKDMAAIIAYAQQLPRIDRELPDHDLKPLSYVLTALDKLPLLPAEKIDHTRILEHEIKAEVSIPYGQYLSNACIGCHRPNMKGGEPIAPGFPVVADITTTGNVGKWSEEQFIQTLRTGKTPEGKSLNPKDMPWNMTAAYTDLELKALYVYLKSL
ncbi:MAG: cytochrome c [Cyclobacteriaceae bacterium]|jgi:mono/diheme cytochrome c family protein|nr:cytochrome c [Cyclobacteriaceae bacterium]